MNFNYYLFDLDNCLLNFNNPSDYFDDVLVRTLKRLDSSAIPNRNDRNKFWFSGDNYKNLLKIWGVVDVNHFWSHFDEIDFNQRKKLVVKKQLNFYNDVISVIKELYSKNRKMAIVSNAADYIVEYIIDIFGVNKYFDVLFGLGFDKDQDIAKPSPVGILKVLEALNFNPNNSKAITIGDSMLDIYAAKKASITACLIKRDMFKYPEGYNKWNYKPDFEIKRLDEILHL